MIDLLKASGTPLIAIAAMVACLTLLVLASLIIWGGLEIESGVGKFVLKVRRRAADPVIALPERGAAATIEVQDALQVGDGAQSSEPVPSTPDAEKVEVSVSDEGWQAYIAYFDAKSIVELDDAWQRLTMVIDNDGLEFWRTQYLRRRCSLGADRGRDAMRCVIWPWSNRPGRCRIR